MQTLPLDVRLISKDHTEFSSQIDAVLSDGAVLVPLRISKEKAVFELSKVGAKGILIYAQIGLGITYKPAPSKGAR